MRNLDERICGELLITYADPALAAASA